MAEDKGPRWSGKDSGPTTNQISAPTISLPKGGGAIRGMGEKFAANPVTGTGSMSVPIATSPGRSGFGPQLSLSYDSGSGNGPFGFGWSLSLPSIARKTEKGLPQYNDAGETDVFILSGAEDLVPVLKPDGTRRDDNTSVAGYSIRRYRPRIEGLFARIERWTRQSDGDTHWRSISKDNALTLYGENVNSRIAAPDDPSRIFSWLICETRDDKGNALRYEYKPDDGVGVDLSKASERNRGERGDVRRSTNRYIKSIRYGNRIPLLNNTGGRPRFLADLPAAQILNAGWMFEVVFDYGEHDANAPQSDDVGQWTYRMDPFSSYRSGFEVRTTRVCQRVLMFHHVPDLATGEKGYEGLVRSTRFTYSHQQEPTSARNPIYTLLRVVTHAGHRRIAGGYQTRTLPPLEFEYTEPSVQDAVEDVDPADRENLPIGVDGTSFQWTDLHGEGIPGILAEHGGGWLYKRNISPIGKSSVEFAPSELVTARPSVALTGAQAQFLDLAGDGQPDLVVWDGPTPGFYEHGDDEGWQQFRPFLSRLNRDVRDPNLRFVDLDGDGHADVLVTEDDALVWYPSLVEAGFGAANRMALALDEERGPRMVFADGTQCMYLADLTGDGLIDLLRIRNSEICYWPNLGYGRFGAKVSMDRAPQFDDPDQFEHRRIRLADIDGTGTTDVIYLHRDGVRLYFNQSGNGWSEARQLNVSPRTNDLVSIMAADLLGNGTACLVWSSSLPGEASTPMRYVNLMGRHKPHLLVKVINNLGAETVIQYAPSTKFYLQDKRDGKPWITRLPFPVHVVERVEIYDRISRNRFVTRYVYHHGYFDGEEREFRGFGMVEKRDTEELAALTAGAPPMAGNEDATSYVPPTLTKTWFHAGVYIGRGHISDYFAGLMDAKDTGEYFREPGLTDDQARALLLPDTELPPGVTLEEEREACRALKGSMLRQEIFAIDGTPKEKYPYSVTEQNFRVRLEQPRGVNRHAVLFSHPDEAITYHYERDPTDPRVQHALTLEVDSLGNVLKQAAVGYGRDKADLSLPLQADRDKQTTRLITYTENRVTNGIDDPPVLPDEYRAPLPCETRIYELTGYTPTGPTGRFQSNSFVQTVGSALVHIFDSEINYEDAPTVGRQRRLIEHIRTLYRKDNLTALLALGQLEPRALPGEAYRLAFTPGLLPKVFLRDGQLLLPTPANVLGGQAGDRGGYVLSQQLKADGRFPGTDLDDHWWIPAGRVLHSPNGNDTAAQELAYAQSHFFLPHRFRDPFHSTAASTEGFVTYDAYDLLMIETRDALGNRVTVGERLLSGVIDPSKPGNDYRVLQPLRVMDPNRNRSLVTFDALGMVVGTAVMGKPEETLGDSLDGLDPDLTEIVLLNHLANPLVDPHAILGRATTRLLYDLFAYLRTQTNPQPQPAAVYSLARETHDSDLGPGQKTKVQHGFSYSDGFGREIQKKIQAEPAIVGGPPRWVGSGWTIFNNKGKPVRSYEPFFSSTHHFEFGLIVGVSGILFYDPMERVVATLHPDHTWEKVVFSPWRQESWDASDTVVDDPKTDADVGDFFRRLPNPEYLPTWHAQRAGGPPGPDQEAATKAEIHARTPSVAHADSLGRTFLTVAHNKMKYSDTPPPAPPIEEFHRTRVTLDIEGNQRVVMDAKDRVVMRYDYDMLGSRIHQSSMEGGARWILNDATGKPLYAWDSRGHRFRSAYDVLRRPTLAHLQEGAGVELLVGRSVYGETQAGAELHNLRGKLFQLFDQAGVSTSIDYDFKGNLTRGQRQLAHEYSTTLVWSVAIPLDAPVYTSRTSYDALNRPIQVIAPHSDQLGFTVNVIQPVYNEANLLDQVHAWLNENAEPVGMLATGTADVHAVTNIDYDAKGQRRLIEFGNGVRTTYTYDPVTFRLVNLLTRRVADDLQNLNYTYDPVGNITHIRDDAQQTLFFKNKRVEPSADYSYDALYRLIEATGREHLGQVGGSPISHSYNDTPRIGMLQPGDGNAMGRYLERYVYDVGGNFEKMKHVGTDPAHPGWTREYVYGESSLIEFGKQSNRLTSTATDPTQPEKYSTGGDGYDAHGNMLRMPHLQEMRWDFKDQLRMSRRQKVNASDNEGATHEGERTWYVYDAGGQRVRKVTELTPGMIKDERFYLGGVEIFRKHGASPLVRETLHIMDDKQRIALVEMRTQGMDASPQQLVRYQFGNHQGSASLELDDLAKIISYEEYTPYGSTSYQAVGGQTEVARRYRYTGRERDEETGFTYHGARYFAPWLGRWTSCDPQGLADGTNIYCYCHCNPIFFSDKNGKQGTPMYSPEGLPLPLVDMNDGSPESSIPKASFSGPSNIRTKAMPSESSSAKPASKTAAQPAKKEADVQQLKRYAYAATNTIGRWESGLGTAVAGTVLVGGSLVVIIGSGGTATPFVLAGATMALGAGVAGMTVGSFQLTQPISRDNARLSEVTQMTMDLGSSPVRLISGTAGAIYTGDESGLRSGIAIGGKIDLAINLGSRLSQTARNVAPTTTSDPTGHTGPDSRVYQLVDEEGAPWRIGETVDVRARLNSHANEFGRSFRGMQIISDPLPLPQARALERSLGETFGEATLSRESSSMYKLGGDWAPELEGISGAGAFKPPTATILNPAYYPWTRGLTWEF